MNFLIDDLRHFIAAPWWVKVISLTLGIPVSILMIKKVIKPYFRWSDKMIAKWFGMIGWIDDSKEKQ